MPAFCKYELELELLSETFSCSFFLGITFKTWSETRFSGLDNFSISVILDLLIFLALTLFSSLRESAFNNSNCVFREGGSGKEIDESRFIDKFGDLLMFSIFFGGVLVILGCVRIDLVGDKLKSGLCLRVSHGCKNL